MDHSRVVHLLYRSSVNPRAKVSMYICASYNVNLVPIGGVNVKFNNVYFKIYLLFTNYIHVLLLAQVIGLPGQISLHIITHCINPCYVCKFTVAYVHVSRWAELRFIKIPSS